MKTVFSLGLLQNWENLQSYIFVRPSVSKVSTGREKVSFHVSPNTKSRGLYNSLTGLILIIKTWNSWGKNLTAWNYPSHITVWMCLISVSPLCCQLCSSTLRQFTLYSTSPEGTSSKNKGLRCNGRIVNSMVKEFFRAWPTQLCATIYKNF